MRYFICLLFALCAGVPAYAQELLPQFFDNGNTGMEYYHKPMKARLDVSDQDFSRVTIGQEVGSDVTIWNAGDEDAVITAIDIPESDVFFVELPALPFVLTPASYRSIVVYFKPRVAGPVTENIVFHAEDTTVTSTLAGTGYMAVVEFAVKALDFSNVETGTSKEMRIAMANTGLRTIQITSFRLSTGANFTISGMPQLPITLVDTENYELPVRFTPSDTGTFSDELIVVVQGVEVRGRLSGRGVKSSTSVQDNSALSATMRAIYPNPAGEEALVEYTLAVPASVRLSLFNAMGEEVLELTDGVQSAGEHAVRIPTGTLPPGMYMCRLTSGNTTVSGRVVIAH
jgi:hypothetical protein